MTSSVASDYFESTSNDTLRRPRRNDHHDMSIPIRIKPKCEPKNETRQQRFSCTSVRAKMISPIRTNRDQNRSISLGIVLSSALSCQGRFFLDWDKDKLHFDVSNELKSEFYKLIPYVMI